MFQHDLRRDFTKCFKNTQIAGRLGTIINAKATKEKLLLTQELLPTKTPVQLDRIPKEGRQLHCRMQTLGKTSGHTSHEWCECSE